MTLPYMGAVAGASIIPGEYIGNMASPNNEIVNGLASTGLSSVAMLLLNAPIGFGVTASIVGSIATKYMAGKAFA